MSIFNKPFNKVQADRLGCCTESSLLCTKSRHPNARSHHDQLGVTTEDQQTKQEMDTMFLEAFNTLSFEERQIQQEQLHGVSDEIVEESTFIENSLQKLEIFLNKTKVGRVYETAERMDAGYAHDRNFRISFLRADRYNAKAAADRMLRFFDEKQKLFGTEKLTKNITIEDLGEDDIAALKAGFLQWAGMDRSNRPIFLQIPGLRKFNELKNELRARYFLTMEGVKSTEAQLRGSVVLTYTVGNCKDMTNGHGFLDHHRLQEALPMCVGAFHFVVDDVKQYLFGAAVAAVSSPYYFARFRLHLGTHVESLYALSSYGIPPALLPISLETNTVDMAPHLRWCRSYTSNVENDGSNKNVTNTSSIIIEASPNDVLSTGWMTSYNFGNDRLRVLVRDLAEAYSKGSYDEKRSIVDGVIGEINGMGGRFLQKKKGAQAWSEIPPSKVRLKITQRFRNHNRRRESAWQQSQECTLIVGNPLPNDVIFGKTQDRNRGTTLLYQLIEDRFEEYDSLDRKMKGVVVDGIIARIRTGGGRFLQPSRSDLTRFVELSSVDSIRNRISSYFRNYRRASKNAAM